MELLGLHRGAALQDPAEEPGAGPGPRLRGVAGREQRGINTVNKTIFIFI